MFESIMNFFKKMAKKQEQTLKSKDAAKERLHLVLMQDRANVSADFLDLMKQEIIEVIKKYIDIDEDAMDVRLTNKENTDGTNGAPALYANIPILSIKDEVRQNAKVEQKSSEKQCKKEQKLEDKKTNQEENKKPEKEDNKKDNQDNKTNNTQKNVDKKEQETKNKKEEKKDVKNSKQDKNINENTKKSEKSK